MVLIVDYQTVLMPIIVFVGVNERAQRRFALTLQSFSTIS
jgi:hypothetical protein